MAESRMRQFKNKGKDDVSLRRRRQEQTIELRKTKRLEALSKRRHVDFVEDGTTNGDDDSFEFEQQKQEQAPAGPVASMPDAHMDLPQEKKECINECLLCLGATVDIPQTMIRIRRLVSTSDTINAVIQSGLLREVVSVAVQSDQRPVLEEFCWILTNITSGTSEQTEEVVQLGCVPVLVGFLQHESPTLQHQSLWALGNIAGNSAVHRDLVAESGIIDYLVARLRCCSPETRKNASERKIVFLAPWVLSNLCRFNNPSPSVELARVLVPILVLILRNPVGLFSQMELRDCCWGLSYLTDGYPDDDGCDPLKELVCMEFNLVRMMIEIVQNTCPKSVSILVPCVRFLGNLCSGTDAQTMVAAEAGVLSVLPPLLGHDVDRLITKEAVWLISNCLSSSHSLVKVVAETGLLATIFNLLMSSTFVVQKECSWAIRNFAMVGSPDMVPFFVQVSGIAVIKCMLGYEDTQVVLNGLEALMATLRGAGDHLERISLIVEEEGILDLLEKLQCSNNSSVADEAFTITDEYFASEENPRLGELMPVAGNGGNAFSFAAPQMPTLTL